MGIEGTLINPKKHFQELFCLLGTLPFFFMLEWEGNSTSKIKVTKRQNQKFRALACSLLTGIPGTAYGQIPVTGEQPAHGVMGQWLLPSDRRCGQPGQPGEQLIGEEPRPILQWLFGI